MAKRHTAGPQLVSQVRRCQELIIARSGSDDFYEVIRLLIAKALHERNSEASPLSAEKASSYLKQNSKTLRRFVDGPATFTAPKDVIEDCLAALSSSNVSGAGFEALDAAFEVLTAKHYKSDKGQYFTPRHVVDFAIKVLKPKSSELICDPACGSGAFLYSTYAHLRGRIKPSHLFGFDISTRATRTAGLMSFLACEDQLCIAQADSLALGGPTIVEAAGYATIEESLATLGVNFKGFDVIATNPPFAGDVGASDYAMGYEVANLGGRKVERDVLFLERCHKLLRPGGRLAIVVPDNKISATKFASLREWLLTRFNLVSVVSLHGHTFRPHTSQKAAIIFASKPRAGATANSQTILLYRSDLPGKTSTGEPIIINGIVDHDLGAIAKDLGDIKWAA
jgi:type I restriction-modification system DNA methylase subunit